MTDDFNEADKYYNELFLVLFGLVYVVFSTYNSGEHCSESKPELL